jgi:hypothetical protein
MGIRTLYGIKINVFWLIVGIIALTLGMGEVYGVDISVLPIVLIIVGANILIKSVFRKN